MEYGVYLSLVSWVRIAYMDASIQAFVRVLDQEKKYSNMLVIIDCTCPYPQT